MSFRIDTTCHFEIIFSSGLKQLTITSVDDQSESVILHPSFIQNKLPTLPVSLSSDLTPEQWSVIDVRVEDQTVQKVISVSRLQLAVDEAIRTRHVMEAVQTGHALNLTWLLKNEPISKNLLRRAMIIAAENGQESIVKLLLEDRPISADLLKAVMYTAAANGHVEIVALLGGLPVR